MQSWCALAASLAVAALALAGPTTAADGPSTAEQRVFTDHHLKNLPASAVLNYTYSKREAGSEPVEDEVVLTTRSEGSRGRVVQVDYLHGERHLVLPEIDHAEGNPVVLYFLEADVRDMHKRLGGVENYFRRRIRLALAEDARVRPVKVNYAGQAVDGTEVSVQPYVDDPLKERFKGMEGKAYVFTFSDRVPGGVYQLRTTVAGSGGDAPVVEEVLTLKGDKR